MSEEIIRKIRALLEHAQGTSNEHEADAFMKKALAMLAEHNLSVADVHAGDEGEEITKYTTNHPYAKSPWISALFIATAKMYFCDGWWDKGRGKFDKQFTWVGTESNIIVAQNMFDYFQTTVDRLAEDYFRQHRSRNARVSFATACGYRLANRIYAYIAEVKAGQPLLSTTGTALVVVDLYKQCEAALGDWIKGQGVKLTTVRRKASVTNAQAAAAGREAGDKINLNTQVGDTNTPAIEH